MTHGRAGRETVRPALYDITRAGRDAVLCVPSSVLFGDRICLRGNMDARIGLEGTPAQVEAAVREQLRIAAPGGRYILSPSNAIGADWPAANVEAFFASARRYGRYGDDGRLS